LTVLASHAIYRLHPSVRLSTAALVALYATVAGFHAMNNSGRYAWEPLVHRMIQEEPSHTNGIMVYAFGSSDEVIAFYLEEEHEKGL
jgi:hypothetical protein